MLSMIMLYSPSLDIKGSDMQACDLEMSHMNLQEFGGQWIKILSMHNSCSVPMH